MLASKPAPAECVVLPGGRSLAYRTFGPVGGHPVLYCHGTPGSGLHWFFHHDAALLHEANLRVIVPDRPGMGASPDQPGRALSDWPCDAAALADALGLDTFAVFGYSCGAPYAFACAAALPDRVRCTVVLGGSGDVTLPELSMMAPRGYLRVLTLGRERPWLSRAIFRAVRAAAHQAPVSTLRLIRALLPPADRSILDEPAMAATCVAMVRHGMRHGTEGTQRDAAIVTSAWGFPLEAVPGPVRLWHGAQDRNVPVGVARVHARVLPDARLTVCPGEGHLSLARRGMREVLGELAAQLGPSGVVRVR